MNDANFGYPPEWWASTARMVNSGFDKFCAKRGMNPTTPGMRGLIAAHAAEGLKRKKGQGGRPNKALQEARKLEADWDALREELVDQ